MIQKSTYSEAKYLVALGLPGHTKNFGGIPLLRLRK